MAEVAKKKNPELWEKAKAKARKRMGGHSARAMQLATKIYKESEESTKAKNPQKINSQNGVKRLAN